MPLPSDGDNISCFCIRLYMSTKASLGSLVQGELAIPLQRTICHQLQPDNAGIARLVLKVLISVEANELETQHQRFSNDIHYLKREERSTQVSYGSYRESIDSH